MDALPPPSPPTPDAALLAVRQATWQALSRILQPGAVITARVVEPLGNNAWLLALRGTTLVAESPLPLERDSIVRIAVTQGGEQPRLRLLDVPTPGPTAPRADPSVLMRQLGLPDTPALRTTVEAFQARGAPLDAATVQRVAAAVADTPVTQRPALAHAHAHVAASGLPATPLTVAWATRALTGALPDPGVRTPPNAPSSAPPAPTSVTPAAPTPGAPAPAASVAALAAGSPTPAPAAATSAGLPAAIAVLARLFPVTALPDPGQGGRPAAVAALELAGLRAQPTPTPSVLPTPADAALAADFNAPARTSAPVEREYPPPALTALARVAAAPGGDSLRPAVIEQGAATVLPPPDLADYDLVLPLPLQDRGAPVPARLAVTTRTSGGGTSATWLRVDAELDGLGPVSIRLSGQSGLVAVHLVAAGSGYAALTAEAESLRAALSDMGLSASVRVSRPEDANHG